MISARSCRTLCTIPFLAAACFFSLSAQAKYSGGTGDPNDPYQIAAAADLIALGDDSNDYDKHFILMADIDLDPNLPGGKVFDKAVIAADANAVEKAFKWTPFTGVFDGHGHTISHLTTKGEDYVGLFGHFGRQITPAGEIKDLAVVDVSMAGTGSCVGGLVGCNDGGAVTRCSSTGMVSGAYLVGGLVGANSNNVAQCSSRATVNGANYVGGLIGDNGGSVTQCNSAGPVTSPGGCVGGLVGRNYGPLGDCCSTGPVNGSSHVGGLVGANLDGGIVTACYSTGAVGGSYWVGGLLGYNLDATVTQCYSTGDATGFSSVGGLVGRNGYGSALTQCYSAGAVSGSGEYVGGLVGDNYGIVTASLWDLQTSGQATSDGGTGQTTAQMQTAATFLDAGWDFVGETVNGAADIWSINEGKDYPRLWWELTPAR